MTATAGVALIDLLLPTAGDDNPVALVVGDRTISRTELHRLIDARRAEIGLDSRSVVVLSSGNNLEFVVTYLALLADRHVPLLVGDRRDAILAAWRPAAAVHCRPDGIDVERLDAMPIDLHPDLALLLSTSGSTGSPKLVRLSQRNLTSNALAIADYLDLTDADRGITSLPMHYCYGLSVLHAHLAVGASVVLTDLSVVDRCFHDMLATHRVTNLAGVPHTFEMLERAGRGTLDGLRFVTQAGGKLAPESVRRWAERLAATDTEFFVMYGQTEATSRMGYLPPALAAEYPNTIGIPLPGGSFEIRSTNGETGEVGELVYHGPNVMMGYAEHVDDLARGGELAELATGDLARWVERPGDAPLVEIVGRRSRFIKPFGLRVDVDLVERELAELAATELAVGGDDRGLVVVAPDSDPDRLVVEATAITGLPTSAVAVVTDRHAPRTESGKVDYGAFRTLTESNPTAPDASDTADSSIAAVLAEVLGRRPASIGPDDTFVSLGGDSLGYVECSIRLEPLLGELPDDWHQRTVAELAALQPTTANQRKTWWPRTDVTVVLRALGICLVLSTHMGLWHFPGGAHMLLAIVGYNLSRFVLDIDDRRERFVAGGRMLGRVAIPTVVWALVGFVAFGAYAVPTVLLANNYLGPSSHRGDHWHFWFIEVLTHLVIITLLVVGTRLGDRVAKRWPYMLPLGLFAATILLRMWETDGEWYNQRYRTHAVAFMFVLGWLAHRSDTNVKRLVTANLAILSLAALPFVSDTGFFRTPARELFIFGSLCAVMWLPRLAIPRPLVRPIATVASASMWIYISHFTIWPYFLTRYDTPVAYVLTLLSGVVVAAVGDRLVALATRVLTRDTRSGTPARGRPGHAPVGTSPIPDTA